MPLPDFKRFTDISNSRKIDGPYDRKRMTIIKRNGKGGVIWIAKKWQKSHLKR